jgi:hypothetical protein
MSQSVTAFTSRFSVTALNNRKSSAAVLKFLPAGECLTSMSLPHLKTDSRLTAKLLLDLGNTVILGIESHGTRDHILCSVTSASLQSTLWLSTWLVSPLRNLGRDRKGKHRFQEILYFSLFSLLRKRDYLAVANQWRASLVKLFGYATIYTCSYDFIIN